MKPRNGVLVSGAIYIGEVHIQMKSVVSGKCFKLMHNMIKLLITTSFYVIYK